MRCFDVSTMLLAALTILALLSGCAGDDDDSSQADDDTSDDDVSDDDTLADDDATDDDADDDGSVYRPIVFVHGFLEDGDAFHAQAQRFATNGYDLDRVFAVDYNTLWATPDAVDLIGGAIDDIRALTGANDVDLIGHSMGGSMGADYLQLAPAPNHVAHYAHVASFDFDTAGIDAPILNLSSEADMVVGEREIAGATNVVLPGLDHLQLATSPETFEQLFTFFNGEPPATLDIEPASPITLSGRTLVFGTNDPAPAQIVRIFSVDPETGERIEAEPVGEFTSGADGAWGPFDAEPDTHYEFEIRDAAGNWPAVRYYREPFLRSSRLAHFRVLPDFETTFALPFKLLPLLGDRVAFATLNLNRAAIAGRDTFVVNGIDLGTDEVTPAEQSVLAAVFADLNFNEVTDGPILPGIVGLFPFFTIYDLYADPVAGEPISIEFNGRVLTIRGDEGPAGSLSIAQFD
ncbi:MAG: alpha/beta fold hydrolase [Deltaproteobacteria bacterium]|nr:alpha/beta fold hydrolase [Deltaproteobacteria bacterium]